MSRVTTVEAGSAADQRHVARGPRWGAVLGVAVALAAAVGSIVLRLEVPVPVGRSGVDDMLFVRLARSVADGQWLGQYTDVTLAKGPGYPVLIAATDVLGVPVKAAEQATYLLACAVVAVAVQLVLRRPTVTAGAYVVLALNPVMFTFQSAELLRDSWYGSLTLLLLASVFVMCLLVMRGARRGWLVAAGVGTGLAGATYWLCREEGVAILPALLVLAVGVPLAARSSTAPGRLRRAGVAAAVAGLSFAVPLAAVVTLNAQHYGVAVTNDFASGAFSQAMAAWARVDGGSRIRQVPLTAHQRELTYAVSPAARELEPYLESAGAPYAQLSCKTAACDYPGALLPWQVRLAAAQAGHFTSGTQYFERLRDEIRASCDDGSLRCSPALPAPLQSLQRTSPAALAGSAGRITADTVASADLLAPGTTYWPDPLNQRGNTSAVVHGIPATDAEASAQAADFATHSGAYDVLSGVYRVLVPVVAALGLVVVVAGWWWVRRPAQPLLVLLVSVAAAYLARTGLLAVVDTTEFDTALPRYEIAGQILVLTFGVVACALALEALGRRREAR